MLQVGSALWDLESNPNILWFSHLNFYLNICACLHLWSSIEPTLTFAWNSLQLTNYGFQKNLRAGSSSILKMGFCSQGIMVKGNKYIDICIPTYNFIPIPKFLYSLTTTRFSHFRSMARFLRTSLVRALRGHLSWLW